MRSPRARSPRTPRERFASRSPRLLPRATNTAGSVMLFGRQGTPAVSRAAMRVKSGSTMGLESRTLCDIFYRSVEDFRKPDALRYKKDGAWRDISSEEFRRAVEELSMGLRALGVERGDRVALLSENRPEW